MKTLRLLLMLLLITTGANAQSKFEIYKFTGNVQSKARYGTQWVKVSNHQEIGITDSIFIPNGGRVSILKLDTKEIYSSLTTGKVKMYDIVRAAKNQANKTLSLANEELRSNLGTKSNELSYGKVGATTRGSDEESTIEDSIVSAIQYLAHQSLNDNLSNSTVLTATAITSDEGVYFSITNNAGDNLYINILCIDKTTKQSHLLYTDLPSETPYIFVPAGQTVSLPMRHFVGLDGLVLVLFGTPDLYDVNVIASDVQYLDITSSAELEYNKCIVGQINSK